MSVKVTDKRNDWNALRKQVSVSPKEVVVGIQKGEEKDGLLVAEYATWNEFGTTTIPARPFMRTYFDKNIDKLTHFAQNAITKVVGGSATIDQFLNALGVMAVSGVKESITHGDWEPNSPQTIKRKQSSVPLIDSGVMRNSVTYAIKKYGETK